MAQPLAVLDGYLVALASAGELSEQSASWVRMARAASAELLEIAEEVIQRVAREDGAHDS
jgi:hypothetical protein